MVKRRPAVLCREELGGGLVAKGGFTAFRMDVDQLYFADLKKRTQRKVYKSCFVPGCQSSTVKTRKKIFVAVPTDRGLRKQWAAMARRVDAKTLKSSSQWYCCEDHFEVSQFMPLVSVCCF